MNPKVWWWIALVGMTACVGFGCDRKQDEADQGGTPSTPKTTDGQGDRKDPPTADPNLEAKKQLEALQGRLREIDAKLSALQQKADKSESDAAEIKANQEERDRIATEVEKLMSEGKR